MQPLARGLLLEAGSGRQIWSYRRPRTRGLAGVAARGVNRGVAVSGDRVFMATDHAHLIALNRQTGALLWDTEMADWHQNYNGTGAPMVVGNLVISGIAGGDEGVRGFVAAYDQATGFGLVQVLGRVSALTVDAGAFALGRAGSVAATTASRTAHQYSVGVNWYPAAVIKYYAEFEHTSFDGGFVARPAENAVMVRAQVAF